MFLARRLAQSSAWDLTVQDITFQSTLGCAWSLPRCGILKWARILSRSLLLQGELWISTGVTKKADFCLCWHWRDSCNSKALLQHGNCAACVVHNWVKEASCNSAVDVGDGVVFTYMNMHTCLSVSRVSFGVIRKDNAIVESDRVKCARLLN